MSEVIVKIRGKWQQGLDLLKYCLSVTAGLTGLIGLNGFNTIILRINA